MDFFTKIGSTFSTIGQGVTKKTKDITASTKNSFAISNNEKLIEELYMSIGRAYYLRNKNDETATDFEQLKEISRLLDEIETIKLEIQNIKGINPCPNCGIDLPTDSAFCYSCGAAIVKKINDADRTKHTNICTNCNRPIEEGVKFCTTCGTPVNFDEDNLDSQNDIDTQSESDILED